jgi:hypothetical protein
MLHSAPQSSAKWSVSVPSMSNTQWRDCVSVQWFDVIVAIRELTISTGRKRLPPGSLAAQREPRPSRTSRSLRSNANGVNGLGRKAMPASSTPWCTMEFSVYPDTYSTFMSGRNGATRSASSRPVMRGITTSVMSRAIFALYCSQSRKASPPFCACSTCSHDDARSYRPCCAPRLHLRRRARFHSAQRDWRRRRLARHESERRVDARQVDPKRGPCASFASKQSMESKMCRTRGVMAAQAQIPPLVTPGHREAA